MEVYGVTKYSSYARVCIVQVTNEEREAQNFVRRYTRRVWFRMWRTMFRYNVLACGRETAEGVRQPRTAKATHNRKPGPYPALEDGSRTADNSASRHPGKDMLGKANTPVGRGTSSSAPENGQSATDGTKEDSVSNVVHPY